MKKMNNKGITLVELIVSFAIVGVAIIYFYQTISTVSKLYANSRDATNDFADSTYVLRLMDAYCNENAETKYSCGDTTTDEEIGVIEGFCEKINGNDCDIQGLTTNPADSKRIGNKYYKTLNMTINGKDYKLLASVTAPITYRVIFKDYNDSTESTIELTSWDDSNNSIQVPSKTNEQRVVSINSSKIEYRYYYKYSKHDGSSATINYGDSLTRDYVKDNYTNYSVSEDGAQTYEIIAKSEKGTLFSYTGAYEVKKEDTSNNWNVKFTSNGTLTFNVPINIDAFLVGGGSAGANSPTSKPQRGGGGGAGGNVVNTKSISLSSSEYFITIGTGGSNEESGGKTNAFGYEATGGTAINPDSANNGRQAGAVGTYFGGDGGYKHEPPTCGSEGVCAFNECSKYSIYGYFASGGTGGVGKTGVLQATADYWSGSISCNGSGGVGGVRSSKQYGNNGGSANSNTGSGGGGATARSGAASGGTSYSGGAGGSGVVIIRNAR